MIGRRPSSEGMQGVTELSSTADAQDRDIKGQISMEEHKCEHNDISYPKGLKWTKQRKCVYQVLEEATEPLSAVQIYNRIEKEHEGSDYAVSTIYRILATFEEHGMVEKTTFMGDGTVVYDLNRGEHTHYAVCLECHKRIPLPSCPFAHVHLEQDTGDFTVTGHKLELYGYCKKCQEARKNH